MKAISKHTEPQNDRLDDLAQLEPVTQEEIEAVKRMTEENDGRATHANRAGEKFPVNGEKAGSD